MAANKPTSLLSLPREIRDEIWRRALTVPSAEASIIMQDNRAYNSEMLTQLDVDSWHLGMDDDHTSPQLLRVCKQIYAEASPIFYSNGVIFTICTSTQATLPLFAELLQRVERFSRPGPYQIKKLLVVVYCDGVNEENIKESEHRDACMIAHFAAAVAERCGTLERVHVIMVDCTFDEKFGRKSEITLPLLRGFGMIHAQKATASMMMFDIAALVEWTMMEEGKSVPVNLMYDDLCELWGEAAGVEREDALEYLKKLEGQERRAGLESARGRSLGPTDELFAETWITILRKATLKIKEVAVDEGAVEDGDVQERGAVGEDEDSEDLRKLLRHLQQARQAFEEVVLDAARNSTTGNDEDGSAISLSDNVDVKIRAYQRKMQFQDLLEGRDGLVEAWVSLTRFEQLFEGVEYTVGKL